MKWISYVYPVPHEPPSHLRRSDPSRSPDYHAELPMPYSSFPLALCAHTSVPISQFIPHTPSVSSHPFPTSVSLLLPWKWVHLYHCSRFHIHALIYGICFSLSDFLHSVWYCLGQSTSLQMTGFLSLCALLGNGPHDDEWAKYKLWVLFFISARPTLPLAFSASPQPAVSHHSPPHRHRDFFRQN